MKVITDSKNTNKFAHSEQSKKAKAVFYRFLSVLNADKFNKYEMAKAIIYAVQNCKSYPNYSCTLTNLLNTMMTCNCSIATEAVVKEAFDQLINLVFKQEFNETQFTEIQTDLEEVSDIYYKFLFALGLLVLKNPDEILTNAVYVSCVDATINKYLSDDTTNVSPEQLKRTTDNFFKERLSNYSEWVLANNLYSPGESSLVTFE